MKKIFLVKQGVNNDYDTYDSFVIACNDAEEARKTNPCGVVFDSNVEYDYDFISSTWVHPDNVEVKLVGVTDLYAENTIICSSFNAG